MNFLKNRPFAEYLRSLLFLACLSMPLITLGQWVPVSNGILGGPINSVTNVGNTVVAATEGGTYLTDDGIHWRPAGPGVGSERATTNLGVGDNLYTCAFLFPDANFLSKDKGLSWMPLGLPVADVQAFRAIGDNIFALQNTGKLYRIKAGETFAQEVVTHFDSIGDIATSSNKIFASRSNGSQLYVSADLGTTWNLIPGLTAPVMYLDAVGSTIMAGNQISTDNGITWRKTGLPGLGYNMVVTANRIILGTWGATYSSTDGISWTRFDQLPSMSGGSTKAGGAYYVATFSGVYRSIDEGLTWSSSNLGISNSNIPVVMAKNQTIFAASANTIYSSNDLGAHWTKLPTGITPGRWISAMIVSGNNILVATGGFTPECGAYISSDDGASWSVIGPTLPRANSFARVKTDVYAGGDKGVFVSHDNGVSWSLVPGSPARLSLVFGVGNTLFAVWYDNLYRYFGGKWTTINGKPGFPTPLNNGNQFPSAIYSMANIGTQIFCPISGNVIHTSTDNGDTWSPATGTSISGIMAVGEQLYAVAINQGLTVSTDRAKTWVPFNNGLINYNILAFNSGNLMANIGYALFLGTYSSGPWITCGVLPQNFPDRQDNDPGIYPNNSLGISLQACANTSPPYIPAETPESGTLSDNEATVDQTVEVITGDLKNYSSSKKIEVSPNPATDRIEIELSPFLSGTSVSVTIIDAMGRELMSSHARGGDKIVVETGTYPRGIYFVNARAGENRFAERFIKQ